MNKNAVIPIILCGGSGTRLWPLSRESYPKQFISIGSDKNKSLLQKTQLRIMDLESRFSKDLSEATFNELKELKKLQKIN